MQITMQDDHGKSAAPKPLLARELFRLIDRNGDGRIDDGEAAQFRAAVERVVRDARERQLQLQRTQDQKDIHADLREIHDDRLDIRDDQRDGDLHDLRDDRQQLRDDQQDLHNDRQDLQQDLRQRAADRPQGTPAPQGEVHLQSVRAPVAPPRTAPAPIRR
jgi:hypothetical protein